jgi:hypothetical protein
MAWTKKETAEAIEELRKILKPGDTVYTSLKHVSRSGMYRIIEVITIQNNQPIWLSQLVAKACRERYDTKSEGVGISGCGMDMGFALVYNLSHTLFPSGFDCIKENCPSNDHHNRENNDHHRDGGYALKQRWL